MTDKIPKRYYALVTESESQTPRAGRGARDFRRQIRLQSLRTTVGILARTVQPPERADYGLMVEAPEAHGSLHQQQRSVLGPASFPERIERLSGWDVRLEFRQRIWHVL